MATSDQALSLTGRKHSADSFARVLHAIVLQARAIVERRRRLSPSAAHDLRLLIKRARALAWFARPVLSGRFSARLKAELQKASHLLSSNRDDDAAVKTLQILVTSVREPRYHRILKETQRKLGKPHEVGHAADLRRTAELLCAIVAEFAAKVETNQDWVSNGKRLAKAARAMRKAGELAQEEDADEAYHDWRKKTKQLLFVLELCDANPTGKKKKLLEAVDELQSTLGDDHDCVVTASRLPRARQGANYVRDLLYRRKTELRKDADKSSRQISKLIK